MSRSRQDLISEVLRIVGVDQTGQEPSTDDAADVDREIDGIVRRLALRKIVYIQDVERIEDEYLRPLAVIVAGSVDTGTPPDVASVQYAEAQLREMQPEPGVNEPVRAVYF